MLKILILSLLLTPISLKAKDYKVSSADEINHLKLLPGDKIIMTSGVWKDQQISFKGKGTAQNPIILTVEKAGATQLTGFSTLKMDGDYLVVDGLDFSNGYADGGAVISTSKNSSFCRITNTRIIDYNPKDKTLDYKWISLYGVHHRLDHCELTGKNHQGTELVVWLSEVPNYDEIDHNYFGPRPDLGVNGGEIIRIGTSEWSQNDSYAKVTNNVFKQCNGEIEIISNKSCHNFISNNLFYECQGTLTFRHGNHSEVSHNYFIGNKVKDTGGIRVIGEDQSVHDNYLYGLTGTSLRAAISVMDAYEHPELNQYWQVKNAVIKNNLIIDCKEAFAIGSGHNDKRVLPPTNLVLEQNIVINPKTLVSFEDQPLQSSIKNNRVKGVDIIDGFELLKSDLMKDKYNLWGLTNQSEAPFWITEKFGPDWKMDKVDLTIK